MLVMADESEATCDLHFSSRDNLNYSKNILVIMMQSAAQMLSENHTCEKQQCSPLKCDMYVYVLNMCGDIFVLQKEQGLP
jgi:hypothetical protein